MDRHLRSPAEFWGEFPLPTVPRSDPDYRDNDYWRGRIWAPATYLVAEGLRRDGEWIAFLTLDGLLQKVSLTGGRPVVLARWPPGGASWGGSWITYRSSS